MNNSRLRFTLVKTSDLPLLKSLAAFTDTRTLICDLRYFPCIILAI